MHQTGFGALKILVFEGRTWCIDLDVLIPQVHRFFFLNNRNAQKCLVHRFWFAAVLGRIDVYMGYSFCSSSLIMKMKTCLPVMSRVIVVITTMMTMKKT